ncbi:MAG: SDR family NAD(P)-dependent oxidoreductase, partial [Rhizobiaceae bacterium]
MDDPQPRFPDLENASVLITGGATGIGAALTSAFAAQGARVAFIDIAAEAGLALARD